MINNKFKLSGVTLFVCVMSGVSFGVSSETVDLTYNVSGDVYGGFYDEQQLLSKGDVAGGKSESGNVVNTNGFDVTGSVYGSGRYPTAPVIGEPPDLTFNSNDNTVVVSGSVIGSWVYGGYAFGGGTANNNTVNVSNSTVKGDVYGGYSFEPEVDHIDVVGNTVTIENSVIGSWVYGGATNQDRYGGYDGPLGENDHFNASDNTVNLIGDVSVGGGIAGGSGQISSGNTLNTDLTSSMRVAKIINFQNYNIGVSGDVEQLVTDYNSKENAMVVVTDRFGDTINDAKADFKVVNKGVTLSSAEKVKAGDTVYLLSTEGATYAQGTTLGDNIDVNTGEYDLDVGLIYKMKVEVGMDEDSVYISAVTPSDQTLPEDPDAPCYGDECQSPNQTLPEDPDAPCYDDECQSPSQTLPEDPNEVPAPDNPILEVDMNAVNRLQPLLDAHLAALSNLNHSSGLAVQTLRDLEPTQFGDVVSFGTIQGNTDKYQSGAIKSNGYSLIVGAGYSFDNAVVGAFFENGKGNYNTSSNFGAYGTTAAMDFTGSGHTHYVGGGLLGKMYLDEAQSIYFDGAVKGGKVKNKYHSNTYSNEGYRVGNLEFDESGGYFSFVVGGGKKFNLTENQVLNSSIHYAYSQLKGNNFTLAETEIKLDKIKSHKLHFNEDYSYQASPLVQLRAGLGFMYEFAAEASGTVDDFTIASVDNKGGTVQANGGVRLTPFNLNDKNKYFDFGVKTYAGKDEGISGNLSFNYNF